MKQRQTLNYGNNNYLKKKKILLKYKKKTFKKKKYLIFSKYKLVIIALLLIIFIIIQIKKQNNLYPFIQENIADINQTLISEQKYDIFERMKIKYSKDPKFNPFLEKITIITHIYNEKYLYIKKKKNNIHISVSLNNKYIYPMLVSIESVLMNCNKINTYIIYHILCYPDLTEDNISILKSLMNKYSLNLEMIFYNMTNSFMNRYTGRYSQATYYKMLTPIFVENDRIIYLDGDTLTFKDLYDMYQMDFNNNYILGAYDYYADGVDYLGIKSKKYINAGVILLNLEKIRNDKMYELIDVINNSSFILKHNDQTLINYVFYPNIGRLPSKYIIFNFHDESDIKVYLKIIRTEVNYDELLEAFKDPTIIHNVLCWPKLWFKHSQYALCCTACTNRHDCDCKKYHSLWYSFANKTDYYKQIRNYYGEKDN